MSVLVTGGGSGLGAGIAALWALTGIFLGKQFNAMNPAGATPPDKQEQLNS